MATEYSEDLLANLQLRYGEGMLSPGGAEQLAALVHGAAVAGGAGLDLGCGLGGYDQLLVSEHGAAHVTGVDVEPHLVEEAARRAEAAGLSERLAFRVVEPGPLPFADGAFDFAFSKDAIVDIPDKAPVLAELHRVTRPGGALLISDWFRADAPMTPEMRAWATTGDETYEMASMRATADELDAAGFAEIETADHGAWFRAFCRDEVARLSGPLYATYVERFGEERARRSVRNAEIRLELAEQGQLLTGHIRARRPA
jgi:phosphoethanolamine N-methyltransferase